MRRATVRRDGAKALAVAALAVACGIAAVSCGSPSHPNSTSQRPSTADSKPGLAGSFPSVSFAPSTTPSTGAGSVPSPDARAQEALSAALTAGLSIVVTAGGGDHVTAAGLDAATSGMHFTTGASTGPAEVSLSASADVLSFAARGSPGVCWYLERDLGTNRSTYGGAASSGSCRALVGRLPPDARRTAFPKL